MLKPSRVMSPRRTGPEARAGTDRAKTEACAGTEACLAQGVLEPRCAGTPRRVLDPRRAGADVCWSRGVLEQRRAGAEACWSRGELEPRRTGLLREFDVASGRMGCTPVVFKDLHAVLFLLLPLCVWRQQWNGHVPV